MFLQKGANQQRMKDNRDKRSKFVESRDDIEVHLLQHTWAPVIEIYGVSIPYDSTIRESN